MHEESWTFTKEEIQQLKEAYNVKTAHDALEHWVFSNYDVQHTNGLDYTIGRNKVTITEYEV